MLGDVYVKDLPSSMGHDHKHVENLERRGRHYEEVTSGCNVHVISDESPPPLRNVGGHYEKTIPMLRKYGILLVLIASALVVCKTIYGARRQAYIEDLCQQLYDDDGEVRQTAFRELKQIGSACVCVPKLIDLFNDEEKRPAIPTSHDVVNHVRALDPEWPCHQTNHPNLPKTVNRV
jgi:hypothetical protein